MNKGGPKGLRSLSLNRRYAQYLSAHGGRLCSLIRLLSKQKDALNALNANNYELKSRRMAVTMSDSRVRSRRK